MQPHDNMCRMQPYPNPFTVRPENITSYPALCESPVVFAMTPLLGSPFHHPFHRDYPFEPAFIRKRNARERQRVKYVNDGYSRLRENLPSELHDKRLSKVETLRAAITYIKHLQKLLNNGNVDGGLDENDCGCIIGKENQDDTKLEIDSDDSSE